MPKQPKLRIFAGPNGSGKTTLFDSIKAIYFSTRLFVNADYLEEIFKKTHFINLSDFDISCNFNQFKQSTIPAWIDRYILRKLQGSV